MALLETFALQALAFQLAGAANGLGFLPGFAFRRLFIGTAKLHLAEDAFALHFLLQRLEGLIDVVISYRDLQRLFSLFMLRLGNLSVSVTRVRYLSYPYCHGKGESLKIDKF